ncbi:hypothetical protein [Gymnodinialimonas ulvae]|uniref:hypothetical protein n=1 Tax=Gymnodinialimonas ulvae TaxID=3126504 RepID=UPI0030A132C5
MTDLASQTNAPATQLARFATDECGAISVDWTMISAAAVGFALATAAYFTDINAFLATNMNTELEGGDLSDSVPIYIAEHFAPLINEGAVTPEAAIELYDAAHEMMNYEIITTLEQGIQQLEAGELTTQELNELVAVASVAQERDLEREETLDHYFGFDGSTPFYASAGTTEVASQ